MDIMTDNIPKIALVSPLKDEIDNIDKFIKALENQTIIIQCLIIVENDSSDGSREYLDKLKTIKNVEYFTVINMHFEDTSYRVGKKYATIIDKGFQSLKEKPFYDKLDYIGILDCDVFPEKDYYYKLTNFLKSNPKIGISSGLIYTEEGKLHLTDPNWVRGGCRLWKKKCFDEAGYKIAYTADTVSVALAHIKGWKTKTLKNSKTFSREVNVRISSYKNKGYHAYYRGHTLIFIILRSFFLIFVKRQMKIGFEFFLGFVDGMLKRKPRIENQAIRNYFKFYLFNKIIGKYK